MILASIHEMCMMQWNSLQVLNWYEVLCHDLPSRSHLGQLSGLLGVKSPYSTFCQQPLTLMRVWPMMKSCMLNASWDSRGGFENKAEFEPDYVNSSFTFLDLCGKKIFSSCLFQFKFRVSQFPGLLLRSATVEMSKTEKKWSFLLDSGRMQQNTLSIHLVSLLWQGLGIRSYPQWE